MRSHLKNRSRRKPYYPNAGILVLQGGEDVKRDVSVVVPDASDMMDASRLQQETLLYPLDCLILPWTQGHDADLVSFDSELQDVAALSPAELVD